MKKLFLCAILLLCGSLQSLKAQNLVNNGDFSSYNCAFNCDVTTFPNYPNLSNLTDWYALTGTPESYAWIESAFMWDGVGSSASDESLIQVFSAPLSSSVCSYDLSIDAYHNNNRGTGGMIVELEDANGVKLQILNTAVANTTSQTYQTTFSIGNTFTKLIIRADAYGVSGYMDLVIDNVIIEETLDPVVSVQAPQINTEICKDGSITLEVNDPNVYRWGLNGNYTAFPTVGGYWNSQQLTLDNSPLPGWPSTANTGTYNISCQIITSGGCTLTSNVLIVSVVDVDNTLTISGTMPFCPGGSVDLMGVVPNPTQTYQWEADYGSGFNPIVGGPGHILSNVTTPGDYRYITTSQNGGCTKTSNIVTVTVFDPLSIISSSTNFLTNGANLLQVDLSGNPPSYSSYTWYRNGVQVAGPCPCPTYAPTEPGEYSVKATSPCGEELSNMIDFKTYCSNPGLNSMSTAIISGGTIYNDPNGYIVSGVLTLPAGGVTFQATTLVMDACSRIDVPIGSSLVLDNTQVVGCDDWEGIIVYGDPTQGRPSPVTLAHGELVVESSFISDAKVGVYAHQGGYVTVRRSRMENNEVHMGYDDYPFLNSSQNGDNSFAKIKRNSCSHSIYSGPIGAYDHAIFAINNSDITFLNSEFLRNEAVLINTSGGLGTNREVSLQMQNCSAMTVNNNTFKSESQYQVHAEYCEDVRMLENTFTGHINNQYYYNIVNAVYLKEVGTNTHLNINDVFNCLHGFEFYNASGGNATMEQNKFEGNTYALMVAPDEDPVINANPLVNSSGTSINLIISCNRFNLNDYAIIGSGNLQTQGALSTDASNIFSGNAFWDALWRYSPAPTYFMNPSPGPLQTGTVIPLDGSLAGSSFNVLSSSGANSCFPRLKQSATGVEEEPFSELSTFGAYPNPFGSQFNITLPEQNIRYELAVYDVAGKLVHQEAIYTTGTQVSVEASSWEAGVYFAQLQSASGTKETIKLVKME